jgi:hypothetical protein
MRHAVGRVKHSIRVEFCSYCFNSFPFWIYASQIFYILALVELAQCGRPPRLIMTSSKRSKTVSLFAVSTNQYVLKSTVSWPEFGPRKDWSEALRNFISTIRPGFSFAKSDVLNRSIASAIRDALTAYCIVTPTC